MKTKERSLQYIYDYVHLRAACRQFDVKDMMNDEL